MMRVMWNNVMPKVQNACQVARASSKSTPGEQLLQPEWRFVESAILPISCFVLPIVLGSVASYMHYSNPAWRKRHGHAPASIRVANPPWPMRHPEE